MPLWMGIAVAPSAYQRTWNGGCDEYEINAILNSSMVVGLNVSLGIATVGLTTGNYSMELIANSANEFSFSVINASNYIPPISTIIYNNETHTFKTDDAISGVYNVTPQLSFPSLDLNSTAPSYVNFESPGGPALAWLSHNGTTVFYTVNTNYHEFWQLKICGSLQPLGDFQIAMGVVFIQHYLDTLYVNQNPSQRPVFLWNIPK